MDLSEGNIEADQENGAQSSTAKRRRARRQKLRGTKSLTHEEVNVDHTAIELAGDLCSNSVNAAPKTQKRDYDTKIKSQQNNRLLEVPLRNTRVKDRIERMSSKDGPVKSRDDILAAREARKLAKQKAKLKDTDYKNNCTARIQLLPTNDPHTMNIVVSEVNNPPKIPTTSETNPTPTISAKAEIPKSKDEVDRAVKMENTEIHKVQRSQENMKFDRAARKASKLAKQKELEETSSKTPLKDGDFKNVKVGEDMTVQDVVNTLRDIASVAKDVQAVTDKVIAIEFLTKKMEGSTISKADLRADRRIKQESQRALKQALQKLSPSEMMKDKRRKQAVKEIEKPKEDNSPKAKAVEKVTEKPKPKSQGMQKMNWFQHLYTEHDKESLKKIPINSNLHPAVVKLGVQLASRVVTGSNARCIALLDALKKMVRDYSLPARTEFARGLEAQLAASVEFLWAVRPPAASQTNALKYFRYHLTQLPNNVDEFDAKKRLQEEIDRYIREQIDMAGEAISIAVRNKISTNDNILTYGCSSLIERILCEAQAAGVVFRAVVVGTRLQRGAREMLRRLLASGVRCSYGDISALNYLMRDVNKVLVGAASLLANGAVLAPAGTLQAALAARAHNVPLLVACETHKFSDTVQTDAFVHNEIGDPDDLIDKNDENSPLKDWRTNPNLSLLNLMYDVTPPSLVTAVVTELAILPCTSAPVVLRFKLSEYGL